MRPVAYLKYTHTQLLTHIHQITDMSPIPVISSLLFLLLNCKCVFFSMSYSITRPDPEGHAFRISDLCQGRQILGGLFNREAAGSIPVQQPHSSALGPTLLLHNTMNKPKGSWEKTASYVSTIGRECTVCIPRHVTLAVMAVTLCDIPGTHHRTHGWFRPCKDMRSWSHSWAYQPCGPRQNPLWTGSEKGEGNGEPWTATSTWR